MNRDTLTGILGALVLITAMTGVFFYERGQFQDFTVTWEPDTTNTQEVTGAPLPHGEDRQHRFNVTLSDAVLTKVTIEVRWDGSTEDTFRLDVTAANGTTHRSHGSGGSVRLEVFVQDPPGDARVADRTEQGAVDQAWALIEEDQQKAGFGAWDVKVTLVDAMRPNQIPVMDDVEGESPYHLSFKEHRWMPVAQAEG